jgi:transposase
MVVCHRLNPGGNRDANRALHVVALNRIRRDPRTRAYLARRTAEGKCKREAMWCLKRYIAYETYRAILRDTGARVRPACRM